MRALPLRILILCVSTSTLHGAPAPKKSAAPSSAGLASKSFEQRVDAIETLAASHDPRAVDLILPMLKDKDATVRWAAATALEELKDARAIPALEEAAHDASPLVSNRAKDAVRALRPSSGAQRAGVVRLAVKNLAGADAATESALLEDAKSAISGAKLSVTDDATAAHVITLTMLPVKEKIQGSETVLEVNFTATVTQLPGNQLRFATRVGAGVAGGVPLSATERRELILDAVHSAAAALGEETAGYLNQH